MNNKRIEFSKQWSVERGAYAAAYIMCAIGVMFEHYRDRENDWRISLVVLGALARGRAGLTAHPRKRPRKNWP